MTFTWRKTSKTELIWELEKILSTAIRFTIIFYILLDSKQSSQCVRVLILQKSFCVVRTLSASIDLRSDHGDDTLLKRFFFFFVETYNCRREENTAKGRTDHLRKRSNVVLEHNPSHCNRSVSIAIVATTIIQTFSSRYSYTAQWCFRGVRRKFSRFFLKNHGYTAYTLKRFAI